MRIPDQLLKQVNLKDPAYQDLIEYFLHQQSLHDSMDVFNRVMRNPQKLKESTNVEIQECLSRGCPYICGFSHLDFKDKLTDSVQDLEEAGGKLWRQLSNQVFMNHE